MILKLCPQAISEYFSKLGHIFATAVYKRRLQFVASSLDFLAISLSKMSLSLISNTDARFHSALRIGLKINLAATATEGSKCDCSAVQGV